QDRAEVTGERIPGDEQPQRVAGRRPPQRVLVGGHSSGVAADGTMHRALVATTTRPAYEPTCTGGRRQAAGGRRQATGGRRQALVAATTRPAYEPTCTGDSVAAGLSPVACRPSPER